MSSTSEQNFPYQGSGQINMNSPFGELVYGICRHPRIRNIIEVGTWNGQGTTVCIMNALDGKDSTLYSIESDRNRYNEAVSFWSRYDTHGKLHLMHGVLHRNPIPDFRILGIVEGDDMFVHHYAPEKRMIEDSAVPLIALDGIRDIDCVVLDGGEYTSDGDFTVLMKFNPRVIILDDTAIYKCRRIRAALLEDERYEPRYDNLLDRNGAAIFVLKGALEDLDLEQIPKERSAPLINSEPKVAKLDAYLFHFSADATRLFFEKLERPSEDVALDEWQPTLWRGVLSSFNLKNGFENLNTLPRGAIVLAALCYPDQLPLGVFSQRKDLQRLVYTLESPNIRHSQQWRAEFLQEHFDTVLTYWAPLLRHPPEGLRVFKCPHNCHHFGDVVPFRANRGVGRSVVMVAERRQGLSGTYSIDGVTLTCLDPLRVTYARGMRNLTVFGIGWDTELEGWSSPVPKLGHSVHRSQDSRAAVDIKRDFVFDLIIENTDAEGYCSEKLYDAFVAGCIPLYRGSIDPTIVPEGTYIDISKFQDGVALQAFLDSMTDADIEEFRKRINEQAPLILAKVGIKSFAEVVRTAISS